jgi:hypothetical protein
VRECVYVDSLDAEVTLACPSWCTVDDHFPDWPPKTADEGFTHHRINFELVLDETGSNECPASAVAVSIWARSEHVRAEAGPAWIELNVTNGSGKGALWIDLTPAQAREVGMKLVKYARAAEADARSAGADLEA